MGALGNVQSIESESDGALRPYLNSISTRAKLSFWPWEKVPGEKEGKGVAMLQ